ncbi:hypothetical protein LK07_13495 [Streptomyces pluripotens]|uniref:Uncharacterized protein n=1 Tax=Streptomyces pluripotens TaxID=1355015 RepID=A0A221P826_9ACTN|nr:MULTISPECIES: hypothetical protein [Streptomyces]ARP74126.1 hypothetical protein LK06_012365 [Streptomyces pluripotens]ASN28391.1 hypothetical protein LK07_13495 [Streptomyces pluripotens]KIE23992.1 hypothetical protein LK08_27370 [Streptomyces sp. MUSC 125]MCH0556681.1 hypothetical protein [Streptomyces sp. MUM 16J]
MSTVPPPERPDEEPGEQPSIPDEQWDSFLRDVTEGTGGTDAPKEPSARARVVARRLREADDAAQRAQAEKRMTGRVTNRFKGRRWWLPRGRRRAAQAPQPATPPGWRTGPAWQEINGKAQRRRRRWAVAGVALAVATALVAIRPSLLLDHLPGHHTAGADASPAPLPAETALPSSAPSAAGQTVLPTRDHPFLGSPAHAWADGADAIELPPAKAVGGMTKDDVALALRRTKEFLVDTSLDPAVLRGGEPTRALSLLDPLQRKMMAWLRQSLRHADKKHDPMNFVSRFDPSEVRLAGKVVKVRGHMTFAAGKPGEVKVHADYTFVYPLVRAGGGDDRVTRAIVRREVTATLADPGRWIATKGKLTVGPFEAETYNNECGIYDGYLHPVFPGDSPTGAPATGAAEDPYDRSQPLKDLFDEGCGDVTRT